MRDPNPSHVPVKPLPGVAAWVGGKRNLALRLAARIEAVPHTCYAEPFIGMGGVFLKRRRRPPAEALNDRAGEVVNVFRVLQRHPRALFEALRFALAARADFARARRTDPATLTDVERAARFIFLQSHAYGGLPTGVFATSAERRGRFNLARMRAFLGAIHRRLQGVYIEQLDFEDFIRRYDRPTTLFYLDPPYWGCESYYGKGLFERADFERLAGVLATIEGRFILSLNDKPAVRRTFAGFTIEPVELTYRVNGVKRVQELIISGRGRQGPAGPAKAAHRR